MRRIRSHLTYANVMATIAVFIALGGGTTAVALSGSNTVFSDDIVNNQVRSADVRNDTLSGPGGLRAVDLAPSSVGASEVANGSLNDEDIDSDPQVNTRAIIGIVPANDCVYEPIGIGQQGDHLLLTPDFGTTAFDLDYGIQYHKDDGNVHIVACNPTNAPIDDGTTDFNIVAIDAQ
jgi:hypothetical protein